MPSPHDQIAGFTEIQPLSALLPVPLQSHVVVVAARPMSGLPIDTQPLEPGNFLIQIHPLQWRRFTPSQRDLLFWHEVARIQARATGSAVWENMIIVLGLSAAVMELPSHAVLALAAALTVAGLAAYRLYQSRQGEQHRRQQTAADQRAIELAMQSGYSFEQAYSSLYEALKLLTKQPLLKAYHGQYQTRLRVLEILSSQRHRWTEPIADPITVASALR
jgi:Protein of unknown function (DUF3318)